jgi:signal peptide peptidase SppA
MKVRPWTLISLTIGWWWSYCPVAASAAPQHVKSGSTSIPKLLLDATGSISRDHALDYQPVRHPAIVDATTKQCSTTQNLTDAWWPLWWGPGKERKKNTTITPTDVDTNKNNKKDEDKKAKASKKRGKHNEVTTINANKKKEKKNNTTAIKKDDKKKDQKSNTTAVKEDPKQHKKQGENKTEDKPGLENTTATETESQTTNTTSSANPPLKPTQSPPFIVLGQPPPGMHISSGPALYNRSPMSPQQQQQMRNAATSLAAIEAVALVLVNFMRLGLLFWASKFLSNRIETIPPTQHFVFEKLNDRFQRDTVALLTALGEPPVGVPLHRWKRVMKRRRRQPKNSISSDIFQSPMLQDVFMKTIIVVEYGDNDLDVQYLADLVSFLITQHQEHAFGSVPYQIEGEDAKTGNKKSLTYFKPVILEVVFKINSPGGSVSTFGLAAAQVNRLRQTEGITTTVCVDKYAASGGYMIASQANKLLAAPFATVGSVGVIAQMLNYHDILKQYGVQPIVMKAGEAKVPITPFGPITKKDLETEQEVLDKIHKQFQEYTILGRPQLAGKELEICNGSTYMGQEAVTLNLVDGIMTSDEYLMQRVQAGDRVLKVHRSHQSRLSPHLRLLSPRDILPFLTKRIQTFLSRPDMAARLVQAGSLLGFLRHLMLKHTSGNPAGF